MSLSPEILLSSAARMRCIANIKKLPSFTYKDVKPKQTASVLVPLCVDDGEVCLLYTLRSSNLNSHSGQVSFPGGKMDSDETVFDTALRETEEEIGVKREHVDIWTDMTMINGRDKNVVITPVVGQIKPFNINELNRNSDEVDEIFTVPMKVLCDPTNHAHLNYENVMIPVYMCGKHNVWGITGMITHLFLQCLLPSNAYKVDFMRKCFDFDELMPSKL